MKIYAMFLGLIVQKLGSHCQVILDKQCFRSLLVPMDNSCDVPRKVLETMPSMPLPKTLFGQSNCDSESIGSFNNSIDSKWRCFPGLPRCIKDMGADFYIFTPEKGLEINQSINFFNLTASVNRLTMNCRNKFFVVIHGFGTEWPKWWMDQLVKALLNLNNNVLVVRWSKKFVSENFLFNYFQSTADVRSISAAMARILSALIGQKKIKLELTTLMGYSLGAHVAGAIGSLTPGLPKIIGIDPAGPLFTCGDPSLRLDQSDAKFVQVLHSNADTLMHGGLGTTQDVGHADFYVNGGTAQPGCPHSVNLSMQSLLSNRSDVVSKLSDDDDKFWCNHRRAMELLLEMLRQEAWTTRSPPVCAFTAFPCVSSKKWLAGECFPCPISGCSMFSHHPSEVQARGKFFFNTQSDRPNGGLFCGSTHMISLTPNINATGKISLTFLVPGNYSQEVTFQGHDETLIANIENRRLITVWAQTYKILILTLKFEPSKSMRFPSSKKFWQLKACKVTNAKNMTIFCKPRPVSVMINKGVQLILRDKI